MVRKTNRFVRAARLLGDYRAVAAARLIDASPGGIRADIIHERRSGGVTTLRKALEEERIWTLMAADAAMGRERRRLEAAARKLAVARRKVGGINRHPPGPNGWGVKDPLHD